MPPKGNASLAGLKSQLRRLPVTVAADVARRAGPAMTELAVSAYDGGRNVYGEPRLSAVNGAPLTLEASGATRRTLRFAVTGTIVRCALGTPWAKYLIGRYGILPNGALPAAWSRRLDGIVRETVLPP